MELILRVQDFGIGHHRASPTSTHRLNSTSRSTIEFTPRGRLLSVPSGSLDPYSSLYPDLIIKHIRICAVGFTYLRLHKSTRTPPQPFPSELALSISPIFNFVRSLSDLVMDATIDMYRGYQMGHYSSSEDSFHLCWSDRQLTCLKWQL